MWPTINRKLIILKVFLFGYYGALGSLWPFLTLHMQQLGLSIEEIAIINLILPFAAAFCKPFIGMIADKTGRYQLLLAVMLITTSTFFTSLLFIPPVPETITTKPHTTYTFSCSNSGAKFTSDNCFEELTIENWTNIEIDQCTNNCLAGLTYPRLCFSGSEEDKEYCVPLGTEDKFAFRIHQDKYMLVNESSCYFPIYETKLRGVTMDIACSLPKDDCQVTCRGIVEGQRLSDEQSVEREQLSMTFWLYLGIRCLAEMILSSCYPVSDAINLHMTSKFGGSFGQQQLVGIFSLGVFSPVAGVFVDYFNSYVPCFVISDLLMLLGVVVIMMIKIDIPKQSAKSMTKGVRRLLSNPSIIALFVVCVALGVIWGYMETYLYLYLLANGGSRFLIGMTQLTSVLPSLPLLYKSTWVMSKFGYVNLLIFAFFVYSLRCVGYVYLLNPWWALMLESTRVFSLYLARLSFTLYSNRLTTPELRVTTQAMVFLLHFDVGRGLGSLFGGFLIDSLGDRTTFKLVAIYAGILGCSYFALYHFYLKDKPHSVPPPTISHNVEKAQQPNGIIPLNPRANGYNRNIQEPLLQ